VTDLTLSVAEQQVQAAGLQFERPNSNTRFVTEHFEYDP
jgi:hypothetical protein